MPEDLAVLDQLLCDPALLAPMLCGGSGCWPTRDATRGRGRPTIAIETHVRLMIIKHRSGWRYETLMREVSDSIHLRRFCRIGMSEPVPHKSTSQIGNPRGGRAAARHRPAGAQPRHQAQGDHVDGAFTTTATNTVLEDLADTGHVAGRQEPGSRRTRHRRQRYRTGTEDASATSNAATSCADHA